MLVFDANEDIQSKKGLFRKAWQERYPGIIEYHAHEALVDVDVADFASVVTDMVNRLEAADGTPLG